MPVWLLTVLMVFATYRLTRIVVKDDFPPVLWLRDRLVGGWRPLTSRETDDLRSAPRTPTGVHLNILKLDPGVPEWMHNTQDIDYEDHRGTQISRWVPRAGWVPYWLADLLSCPWCASGWVALAVTTGTAFTVGVPAPVLVWPAVWGAAALLAARKWS